MRGFVLIAVSIFVQLSLSACTNAYTQFYSGTRYSNGSGQCRVAGSFNRSEASQVVSRMENNGFSLIGESSFQSGDSPSQADALRACNEVGADVVVIMIPEYVGSQTYSYQTQQYHPGQPYFATSTTDFNGSANYYGNFGNTNYYGSAYGRGSATTTTVGMTPGYTTSQTNYITAHRYNYGAMFFKSKDERGAKTSKKRRRAQQKINYASDEDSENRDDYARCFRSEGYVEPEDVCSGSGSAIDGDVYWNPQYQACMKYDRRSSHVQEFCE